MEYRMMESEKLPTGLVMNGDTVRKLIAENPNLPLVFMANENANNGDYSYMFCTRATAEIGEILDCWQRINPDITYTDREEFEEAIFDQIDELTGYDDRPEAWYEQEAKRIAEMYAPFWRSCILVTVGN